MNLRDTLLSSLAKLPGTREFHLHTLVSAPRKHSALFPFSQPRTKSYLQDILVLLSEQPTPDSPRILVTAIEVCVYTIPSTSCAILYVSKVDSTGQSSVAPSPTSTLVKSLLTYYGDPTTRPVSADHLWIHLFARAQGQYLFPNSADYEGKHPLSDVKLCAWWRRVLTDVAGDLNARRKSDTKVKLHYVLPGYSEPEATQSLKFAFPPASDSSTSLSWTYGHPYSQTEIPLPCPHHGKQHLGHYIPSFDDDPKSRFMDEIAYTTEADGVKSPERKRSRKMSHSDGRKLTEGLEEGDGVDEKDERPLGDLGRVTPDEFWERMSFRQECVAGAVTGFFTLVVSSPKDSDIPRSEVSPLAPQPGQVSSQINKRIMTSLMTGVEFSTVERAIRATETIEGAIKGLCEGLVPIPAPKPLSSRISPLSRESDRRTPEPEPGSRENLLAPPRTPPPRLVNGQRPIADISPNPFPEPVTSLETYHSHIYGSICVSNASLPSKPLDGNNGGTQLNSAHKPSAPQVTILTARKKKKRTDAVRV